MPIWILPCPTWWRVPCITPGNFYLPTLLADVQSRAEVMREESFGPLLPVRAVDSDAQALVEMNASRYGLTASVWSRRRERAEWFAPRLDVGTVYQNRCDYLDPGLPWTGVKDSGRGTSLSPYGYYALTRPKSMHSGRRRIDVSGPVGGDARGLALVSTAAFC